MKYFLPTFFALIIVFGIGAPLAAVHAASEIGITQIDTLDQLPPQWVPIVDATGGVIWDQDCFYDQNGNCRSRHIGGNLPDRVCTRGTGEGNYCGMVVEFGSDATGGSCTPTNICSGASVVNSCTGAVVQQCSNACISGSCSTGGGTGSGGGGTGTGTGTTTATGSICTAGPICSGTDLHYRNSDCSETLLQQCAYGCAASSCVMPSQSPTAPALSFLANPPLIRKGSTCELQFSAKNVSKCTLVGTGLNATYTATNGVLASTTATTPGLINTTSYVLSCTGQQGNIQKTVDCKVTPTFQEF